MRRAGITFFVAITTAAAVSAGEVGGGRAIVREINLARTQPAIYAGYLEELRGRFQGKIFLLPDGRLLRTKEGVAAVDEAIRFLRRSRPLPALIDSPGIARAAADHVADQANGGIGHAGTDRTNPGERMKRYGSWSGLWGENISYGEMMARDVVIGLIVDDGLHARKHRKNIFNPAFHFAGAAIGPHAHYRTVCSIDFAAGYVEATGPSRELLARN